MSFMASLGRPGASTSPVLAPPGHELLTAVQNGHKDSVMYLLSQGYLNQLQQQGASLHSVLQVRRPLHIAVRPRHSLLFVLSGTPILCFRSFHASTRHTSCVVARVVRCSLSISLASLLLCPCRPLSAGRCNFPPRLFVQMRFKNFLDTFRLMLFIG